MADEKANDDGGENNDDRFIPKRSSGGGMGSSMPGRFEDEMELHEGAVSSGYEEFSIHQGDDDADDD